LAKRNIAIVSQPTGRLRDYISRRKAFGEGAIKNIFIHWQNIMGLENGPIRQIHDA
jgi:hypothetical protein